LTVFVMDARLVLVEAQHVCPERECGIDELWLEWQTTGAVVEVPSREPHDRRSRIRHTTKRTEAQLLPATRAARRDQAHGGTRLGCNKPAFRA
jgi:hypothetical protein